jgi:type I restriction enzyme S subunit
MTDWPVKTLGDVCEVIAGQSPEGKFYNKEGKGVPFYQGKKDFAERVLGSPTTWTTEVTKLSRPGDILMSVRAPVGPVNLCPIEACIGRGLAAIRPSSKTDTDFIFYYLESIQSEIAGTEGAVFASINKAQIADLRCPVPPLEEQKRIVALLDAATARVTELAACYEQARTHANNLFTSALRDALESNPEWPVKTLGDVCEVIAGQSPEGKFYNKEGKGVPFYQGKKDFAERVLGSPTTWTTEVTKLSRPGDILMSVRAPVGPVNLCPIEACIGRGLAAIRPSSKTDTDFIFYYLESIQSEIAGTEGAVFASINKAQIADLRCPVPPLEEQKRIVTRLDSMRVKTSEMVAAYDSKLTAGKNLRQSILEAAFAGEL